MERVAGLNGTAKASRPVPQNSGIGGSRPSGFSSQCSDHTKRVWQQKLRESEVRSEAHRAAARVAEATLQESLARIGDLEERNRLLAEELQNQDRGQGGGEAQEHTIIGGHGGCSSSSTMGGRNLPVEESGAVGGYSTSNGWQPGEDEVGSVLQSHGSGVAVDSRTQSAWTVGNGANQGVGGVSRGVGGNGSNIVGSASGNSSLSCRGAASVLGASSPCVKGTVMATMDGGREVGGVGGCVTGGGGGGVGCGQMGDAGGAAESGSGSYRHLLWESRRLRQEALSVVSAGPSRPEGLGLGLGAGVGGGAPSPRGEGAAVPSPRSVQKHVVPTSEVLTHEGVDEPPSQSQDLSLMPPLHRRYRRSLDILSGGKKFLGQ
ncbi:unnamed protein product, partial [Discosporangium mesarthrocarpum]